MKTYQRFLSLLLAAVLLLGMTASAMPLEARAASSSEIRKQITQLQKEKAEIKEKIKDVESDYKENENEIADLMARKAVIDQQVQLLWEQIENLNAQLSTYNVLIADKQDELDAATVRYRGMNEENRVRVRTMEEDGEISYWDVIFKASSFADLLDRLNMVAEIAAADNKHLRELSDAAQVVEQAQTDLAAEKEEVEAARLELDETEAELDAKQQEALALLQELLTKADDLEALRLDFEAQDEEFLKQIAAKEVEFTAAKQAEWEAYMATYVPPTTAAAGTTGSSGSSSGSGSGSGGSDSSGSSGTSSGGTAGGGGGTWLIPTSYSEISSPFGNRTSPTAGASSYHQGVDLRAPAGTPIVASRAGIVTISSYGSSAGNYVQINHQDGFSSIYMHMSSRSVSAGQIVSAGQNIGTVGATGVATGNHLHFGISYNGVYVNPCNYVNLG